MTDDVPVDSFSRDCPDCGAVVAADATRCPDCGATLGGEPASGPVDAGRSESEAIPGHDAPAAAEQFPDVGRELAADVPDDADSAGDADDVGAIADADDVDAAPRTAFAVAAVTVGYLHVSYAMVLVPSTAAIARSDPVLLADAAAFVVLPVATLVDATLVRRAGTWSARRWVWVPLVAVPVLDLLTGPAYLLVRFWRT